MPVLLLGLFPRWAASQAVTFEKTFGSSSVEEVCRSVRQASGGGYILAGSTYDYADTMGDPGDVWIVKTDGNGNFVWDKTFGGIGADRGFCVRVTGDNGFIIAGSDYDSGFADFYLIRLDSSGNVQWTKNYFDGSLADAHSVDETSDGGFFMAGSSLSGLTSMYLIRTDVNGDTLWRKKYNINNGVAYDGIQTLDGGFAAASSSYGKMALMKTGSQGDSLWQKYYDPGFGLKVIQLADSSFILLGMSASYDTTHLVKTDKYGNIIWRQYHTRICGNLDDPHELWPAADGGFIYAHSDCGFTLNDAAFVKTDAAGNIEWARTLGAFGQDGAHSVQQTADAGYIVAGFSQDTASGYFDYYLIKTDSSGCILPLADFAADTTFIKIGDSLQFSDESIMGSMNSYIIDWFWDFGDGNYSFVQNPFHAYSAPDTFTVTLRVTNVMGCSSIMTKTRYIIAFCLEADEPVIMAVRASLCMGESDTLRIAGGSLNNSANWYWYKDSCGVTPAGVGTSIIVNPLVTDTWYARGGGGCAADGMCGSVTVTVNPVPSADLGADTVICDTSTVILDAGAGAAAYSWNTGDSTQSIAVQGSVSGTGVHTFFVEVTDSNNCTASDTVRVTVVNCTGLGKPAGPAMARVYPNPVSENLMIQFRHFAEATLFLRDITGSVMKSVPAAGQNARISMDEFPAGFYILTIEAGVLSESFRIILMK